MPTVTRAEPADAWLAGLRERLDQQAGAGLRRRAVTPPTGLIDLASNDYLDLRRHPRLIAAAMRVLGEGVGAGSSRLVAGTSAGHTDFEARLAAFKGAERALLMPSGYHAGLATLTALATPGDLILLDRLCHASLIDAALLARARSPSIRVGRFAHNDAADAQRRARRHADRAPGSTVWIVTESVFSMDGDVAPLAGLAAVRDEVRAAGGRSAIVLDEAHATGVLGPGGAGLSAECPGAADVCVLTGSKALGAWGGAVTGPGVVIDALVNFARPLIYTTATPPVLPAILGASLDVIEREPDRRARLHAIARAVRAGLRDLGWPAGAQGADPTPVVPLVVGSARRAEALSARLADGGFFAPAIRPPTVPARACRVRLSLHAALRDHDAERMLAAIGPYDAATRA
ncbi:MAG: 8-amino-7-oxononanoate synthase [Planctomycetota bacterium]|nr:MAG: 8-amino-7-oxononanoate synthase [Planctomycetota bacterium]